MKLEDLIRLLQFGGPVAGNGSGGAGRLAPGLLASLGGIPGISIAMLPALLSLIGGDPEKRNREEAMKLSSPEHLLSVQQEVLRRLGAMPENVAARSNIVGQSSQLSNALTRSLADRGLGTTGIASVAQPIANSAVSGRLGSFEGALSSGALSHAQELVRNQIAALLGHEYGQSRLQGGLDRSFGALLPAVGDYYKRRYQAPVARIA